MVVTVQHDIGSRLIESLPKDLDTGDVPMFAGAKAWPVPVRERTYSLILGQVSLKPPDLERTCTMGDLAIEDDDMPGSQVVGAVAFAVLGTVCVEGRACVSKVSIVPGRACRMVVVIAERWTGTIFVSSPGRIIAVVEFAQCAVGVRIISQSDDGS